MYVVGCGYSVQCMVWSMYVCMYSVQSTVRSSGYGCAGELIVSCVCLGVGEIGLRGTTGDYSTVLVGRNGVYELFFAGSSPFCTKYMEEMDKLKSYLYIE